MESIKKASAQQHDFLDFKSVLNASLNAAGELVSRSRILPKWAAPATLNFIDFTRLKINLQEGVWKFFY